MLQTLTCILIDDEERARNTLSALLSEHCPEVAILDMCKNVPEAVLSINKNRPHLIFLDIEMPEYSGFELLDFFRTVDFEIIFVTAYSEYAIRAFEVSAVDYLLKPVQVDALKLAVKKTAERKMASNMQQRPEVLKEAFTGEKLQKIALPMSDGLLFVDIQELVMLEAEGSYTNVFLKDGSKILVSKKLKFFEDLLEGRVTFFRPHRSYIIHMNYIKKYIRGENTLLMDNRMHVNLAREKKPEFELVLKELRLTL